MVSAQLIDLKTLTAEVERIKTEDVVGASWEALVASESLQTRRIGALLVKIGAKGRGEREERRQGRKGGR